jgi:hypothetical protein
MGGDPGPNIVEMVHRLDFNVQQEMSFANARVRLLEAKAKLADCYSALEDAQRDVRLAESHINDVCLGVATAAQQIGNWEVRPDGKGLQRQAKKEG